MDKLLVDKVFVLHVKSGYKDREISIRRQLEAHQIDFEFMLDGDIPDIQPIHIDTYFSGDMGKISPTTSCALKHLLVYEKMIKEQIRSSLVFEDDILLDQNFNEIFNKSIAELESRDDINKELTFISYEDSTLEYIPKNLVIQGQYLYAEKRGRCAGAYYLNLKAAQTILDYTRQKKCNLPLDWFHNEIFANTDLKIYWCHPAIATQGSHSGKFKSSLDNKSHGLFQKIVFSIRKYLRKRK